LSTQLRPRLALVLFTLSGGLAACGEATSSRGEGAGPRVVVETLPQPAPDQWRVRVKRLAAGDAGASTRQLTDNTVAVDGTTVRADGFSVTPAMLPPGEGSLYLHAVGLAGGVPVVVADGALGRDSGDSVAIAGWAYEAACDLDGDTFRDCTNVAAACCATLPIAERGELADCVDDPADVPMPDVPDRKARAAETVSPFEATETPDDYSRCDNQLDDDCTGGDLPCTRIDADGDGYDFGEDCDDTDAAVHPGALDAPGDGVDQDCDGADGAGTDQDGDGYIVDDPDPATVDCDDGNPSVHPGAGEASCDAIDQDCDGADVCLSDGESKDLDGDGVATPDDCDDHDAGRRPGAREDCGDGVDQDCDGADAPCAPDDGDKDGVPAGEDCDDGNPDIYPGAPEICGDAFDQDCDGVIPTCADVTDGDGDTWSQPGDCDDRDPAVHPGAVERCNNLDDDCDGVVDEGNPRLFGDDETPHPETCGRDEGGCRLGPQVCAHQADGTVFDLCLGELGSMEVCDGFDNDCDGLTDVLPGGEPLPGEAETACGPELERGACRRGMLYCQSGSLSECRGAVTPIDELCNGLDDDCNGQVDDGPGGVSLFESCYGGDAATRDIGECRVGIRRCAGGAFAACEGEVLPRPELCNGIDDDCNGQVDDGASAPCWEFDPALRGVGACRDGERACVDGVLGECLGEVPPSAEICDGLDNDCDGIADAFSAPCYSGPPETLGRNRPCHEGLQVCADGALGECVGEVVPAPELCNRQDDDCNGAPDDAFDLATDPLNCGGCGLVCGAGLACCGGACRDLGAVENCGGCGVACGAGADHCAVVNGGQAECVCGDGPACVGGLRCIAGACLCASNDDCGPDALCCDGRCEATDPGPGGQCATCGDGGCAPDSAQNCVHRECRCGDNAACQAGATVCGQRNGQGDFLCLGCVDNGNCGPTERCCDRVCTPTNPDAQCEACGLACDPSRADTCAPVGAGAGRDFDCVCGGTGAACDPGGPAPFCVGGACVACREDADCGGAAGAGQCVQNVCRACDPADNAGCGEQQLCCGDQCQATGPGAGQSCQACGVSCDEGTTNTCAFRLCGCGDGPPCGGATPVCDDARGVCIECLADADCANDPDGRQCVDRVCRPCDPNGHEGCAGGELCCVGAGGGLRCEATAAGAGDQCEACDVACGARETNACAGRACGCGNQAPCGGATPVCDDQRGTCVECLADADCAGRPGGGQCVSNVCRPCDAADHAGCAGDQLCCNGQCTATGGGAGQSCEACGQACDGTADACRSRDCQCGATGAACPPGRMCVDGACPQCVDNSQCGANELCCGNVCQPTGAGAGQSCQACGQSCNAGNSSTCDGRTCRCGNNAACGGNTPICDDLRGACVQCVADADCPNNGQCVANQCRACDPADQAGCAANQLCCNFQCEATGPAMNQQCQVCDMACGQDATNACNNRQCRCGNGGPCGGNTPYCNDMTGVCTACRNDNDCGGMTPQCAGGACRACDPADDAGCGRKVCGNDYRCHNCERDSDCNDNPHGNDCHNDGTCHN
jgi:hypothetical protein